MTNILLIDADTTRRNSIAAGLAEHGLIVSERDQAPTANLPTGDELSAACMIIVDAEDHTDLIELYKQAPLILLCTSASIPAAVNRMREGAQDYLQWPVNISELVIAIERASVHSNQGQDSVLAQFPLIGESNSMQMLKESIGKVGPTVSPVLILGPSGTGKELVARAIHASSPRASEPLITINCATVPHNLVEAELFGAEQFQHDSPVKTGLVSAAHNGTLFLDEIADLPESAQAKLVQVLQGENRRLGATAPESIDIRVIAASHRDIAKLVEDGQFRRDLYYRLNVVCFELPPLRARQNDVLVIADWLLARTSQRLNKAGLSFSLEAVTAMKKYAWPGNIRELENAVERAVILSDPNCQISQNLLAIETINEAADTEPAPNGELTSLEDYFVKFVQQHQDQLTETELAEKLGISRKSLWERRQRLNIPRRKTRKRGSRQGSISN